jgi:hypothetical protein
MYMCRVCPLLFCIKWALKMVQKIVLLTYLSEKYAHLISIIYVYLSRRVKYGRIVITERVVFDHRPLRTNECKVYAACR